MTRSFVYAPDAQAELREIIRYTAQHWGPAQARSYAIQIEEAATALATGQGIYKNLDTVLLGLRLKAVGSHFVFCLIRPAKVPLVLAILHRRMDLMARLEGRLR